MPKLNRRHFLKTAVTAAALPAGLTDAKAIPAARRTGAIEDVSMS